MTTTNVGEIDVGLPRRLPAGSIYLGETTGGHVAWRVDFDEDGRRRLRCQECGGTWVGITDEECPGRVFA